MARVGEKYSGFSENHRLGMFLEDEIRATMHGRSTKAMTAMVANASNNSIAGSTWRSYRPVIKHLEDCQEFVEERFGNDPTKRDAITFVAFLAAERQLRADTISKYLSAWRMLLLALGRDSKNLRPSVVTQTLKGLRNLEDEQGKRAVRQCVTLPMLKLLHMLLMKKNRWKWSSRKRATIWAGALVCFWGGFRGGELFSSKTE